MHTHPGTVATVGTPVAALEMHRTHHGPGFRSQTENATPCQQTHRASRHIVPMHITNKRRGGTDGGRCKLPCSTVCAVDKTQGLVVGHQVMQTIRLYSVMDHALFAGGMSVVLCYGFLHFELLMVLRSLGNARDDLALAQGCRAWLEAGGPRGRKSSA